MAPLLGWLAIDYDQDISRIGLGIGFSSLPYRNAPFLRDTPVTHQFHRTHRRSRLDTLVCRDTPVEKLCVTTISCNLTVVCQFKFNKRIDVLLLHNSWTYMHTNSFILDISISPLQVHYYSEALPTQHGYFVGVSHQSATGNCE